MVMFHSVQSKIVSVTWFVKKFSAVAGEKNERYLSMLGKQTVTCWADKHQTWNKTFNSNVSQCFWTGFVYMHLHGALLWRLTWWNNHIPETLTFPCSSSFLSNCSRYSLGLVYNFYSPTVALFTGIKWSHSHLNATQPDLCPGSQLSVICFFFFRFHSTVKLIARCSVYKLRPQKLKQIDDHLLYA